MADGPLGEVFRARIAESVAVKEALLADLAVETMAEIAAAALAALTAGHKILFFGNGGSAADAQHLAAELMGRFRLERRALPALALADNSSSVTAIANDYGYDDVFSRQIEGLADAGDVAIGISTSGRSANVIRGLETAAARGLTTVALTGSGGEALRAICDHCLCVPSTDTARIQECHMLVGHTLCEAVEAELFVAAGR
jgi:D-sedoheptulose 7-phosphate isomerase